LTLPACTLSSCVSCVSPQKSGTKSAVWKSAAADAFVRLHLDSAALALLVAQPLREAFTARLSSLASPELTEHVTGAVSVCAVAVV
jgi:hypothetical protein